MEIKILFIMSYIGIIDTVGEKMWIWWNVIYHKLGCKVFESRNYIQRTW